MTASVNVHIVPQADVFLISGFVYMHVVASMLHEIYNGTFSEVSMSLQSYLLLIRDSPG